MCDHYGFSWDTTPSTVRITKSFTPGDKNALRLCNMLYSTLMAFAPLRAKSVQGTDGQAALDSGMFQMSKTGATGGPFLKALAALR